MKESVKKIITYVSLTIAILVSVCAILFAANQEKFGGLFDVAFWILVCFIVLSLILWLFFGIISVIKKPKKALIALGAIAIVLIAAFLIAGGDSMPQDFLTRYETSATTAKLIATACYTTYAALIIAVVLMIYVEISKAFKK
jgi:hypothetical protein